MKQQCSLCSHLSRKAIDAAILAGTPYRELASEYRVSPSGISRHRSHINALGDGGSRGDHPVDDIEFGIRASRSLVLRAQRKGGDLEASITLKAIAQIAALVELRCRLEGRRPALTETRGRGTAEVILPARTGIGDLVSALEKIYGIHIRDPRTAIGAIRNSGPTDNLNSQVL